MDHIKVWLMFVGDRIWASKELLFAIAITGAIILYNWPPPA